jgi:hypothetical protein
VSVRRIFNVFWDPNFEDIERIVKAFPSALENDVRAVASILPLSERTLHLAHGNVRHIDCLVTDFKPLILNVWKEEVCVPYRIYINEPMDDKTANLSERQQVILHCLYLRHHNGYIRQKHLEALKGRAETFICPFTVQLLGEYVVEILLVLENLIAPSVLGDYAQFLSANAFYWKQTQSRMVSYWNEYYRSESPSLSDYVGKRLVGPTQRCHTSRQLVSCITPRRYLPLSRSATSG